MAERRGAKRSGRSRAKRGRKDRAGGESRSRRDRRRDREKGGWFRHPLVRFLIVSGLVAACLGLFVVALILFHYDRQAARFDLSAVGRLPMETEILDATGARIGYLHGEDVGVPVELDSVSRHFLDALIAREDSRFYRHHGIDRYGLVRAWIRNLREGRTVQGASTITMQLTRMTYGLSGRNMQRKLLEMAIARRIEKHYEKDEILSRYVNRIFLGTGMNGIQQAATGYFGKPASDLTLPEAAMIAGVIRAPNGFSPFRHYEKALAEMRSTLSRMEDEGMITAEQAEAHSQARPEVLPQSRWMKILREQAKISERTHLLDMIENRVEELVPSLAGVGGLTVRTTFDLRLQNATRASVARRLSEIESLPGYGHPTYSEYTSGDPEYLQAAVSVVENFTGAFRAVVGGRDHDHSQFHRAIRSRRPMGSVFKPLVYGAAFERGLFPGVLISDARIEPGEIPWDPEGWDPNNADGVHGGPMPAEVGLIRSRNTMTARVGEWAGIENVLTMMEHAGLGDPGEEISPTIYIGTLGASVNRLASAYTIFATGGIRHEPFFIQAIEDRDGSLLYEHEGGSYRVLSPGATWLTSNILERVVSEGGTAAALRERGFTAPAGGKTGTTNDFFDAWFSGYTSRLSGCVWIGLDQPDTILEGAYGGAIAMPVWQDIMTEAENLGYEFTDFASPEEVIEMQLCRESGKLARDDCEEAGALYIERVPHDLIPRKFCDRH